MTSEQTWNQRLETELTGFTNRIRNLFGEQTNAAYEEGKKFGRTEHLSQLKDWATQELEDYEDGTRPASEG